MEDEILKDPRDPGEEEAPAAEEVQGPRIFVVGMGQTGRELLYRLMKHARVVGLDVEERKFELAKDRVLGGLAELAKKDATSRISWEELGLNPDDVVVTTTRRDEVNVEVCRIVKENFGVKRMLGLIHSSSRIEEYEKLGVETVNRAKVLGAFLEARVLQDRRTALNVGLGQGEILEVPILPGSPVVGRPLSTYRARPWLVGAIYRNEKLVVPHGHTVIQEGDRVVLIGEPHVLNGIADFFKMGQPEFPLQYGPLIGVLAGGGKDSNEDLVSESHYLASNTKATSVVMLHLPGQAEPDLEVAERICGGVGVTCEMANFLHDDDDPQRRSSQAQDFGCVVLSQKRLGLLRRTGMLSSVLTRVLERAQYPVLVSRGSHPYKNILAPVSVKNSPYAVAQLGIDLSRLFNATLGAVTVTEPRFAVGEEEVAEQRKILDKVVERSSLYRHHVNIIHVEGNPIKKVVELAKDSDLLLLGHRKGRRSFWPRMNITFEILDRVDCSVMVLPYTGEED